MWNEDRQASLEKLERQTFGLDHQAVGALMAEKWQFPDYLLESILHHHNGSTKSSVPMAVTAVSQIRYNQPGQEQDEYEQMLEILENSLETSPALSQKILERASQEADEFYAIFSG